MFSKCANFCNPENPQNNPLNPAKVKIFIYCAFYMRHQPDHRLPTCKLMTGLLKRSRFSNRNGFMGIGNASVRKLWQVFGNHLHHLMPNVIALIVASDKNEKNNIFFNEEDDGVDGGNGGRKWGLIGGGVNLLIKGGWGVKEGRCGRSGLPFREGEAKKEGGKAASPVGEEIGDGKVYL